MPKKPLVKIDVSWQTAKLLVLGGDSFWGESFLTQLEESQLEIWSVVREKVDFLSPQVKTLSLSSSWLKQLPEKIDYVVDFLNLPEAARLARKNQARLLTVLDLEKNKELKKRTKEDFDWRVVKAAFVYGPARTEYSAGLINQILVQAVLNEKIIIPFSERGKIYPLWINDLVDFLKQALFSPSFVQQEAVLAGEEVSWQEFLDYLEEKAQHTAGVGVSSTLVLPEIDFAEVQETWKNFDWQPQVKWSEGINQTLQFFFQKKEKGELELPSLETKTTAPSVGWQTKVLPSEPEFKTEVGETEAKTPPLAIDQDFWEKGKEELVSFQKKKRKKKVKKRIRKKSVKKKIISQKKEFSPETVVIQEEWEGKEETPPSSSSFPEEKREKKVLSAVKKRWWRQLGSFLGIVLLISGLFWGSCFFSLVYLGWGGWRLQKAVGAVQSSRWEEASSQAQRADWAFKKSLVFLSWRPAERIFRGAKLGEKAANVIIQGARVALLGRQLGEIVWQEKGGLADLQQELLVSQENLTREVVLLEAELSGKLDFLPAPLMEKAPFWRDKIKKVRQALVKTNRLLPYLSWFLGEDKPRRFLVLLQNSMELRPTGGFIGSLAVFNFASGNLVDFQVQDVYSVDGQLKGHVEPPKQIKEILGEGGWYLRDSNWNPDFPASAQKAAWFFRKETGQETDGVLALNLAAVQKILKQTGEIWLSDFEEKINADNLFAKAEFYAETNFFPGSQQKSSFLSALARQILATVRNNPAKMGLPLAQALWESLEEKELLVWTTQAKINQVLQENNWDGRVKKIASRKENSFTDYLFPVEANLGVNKANYFLRRILNLSVQITDQGKIDYLFQVHYENTAQTKEWPAGDYKNYFRLLLPLGSKIEKVSIFDPLAGREASEKVIEEDQLEETRYQDKMVLGFLVEVPLNSRRTVEIAYSRQAKLTGETLYYLLYLQKQPGMGATPLTVLISWPAAYKPLQVTPAATLTQQGLVFNQDFRGDIPVALELSR